ncbi:Lipoprotein Med [Commensalibacter communis]|uniref:BMP family ABC transporter substrate-binding protein n=1 Tax=Commensalibacter communis TaxID=2972786 RepID=UPI0022FFA326|nr:BMP family ABC transporter substrate-binding protein [Commensalibacter communis]CAI3954555.1 Lipoprotein Med [Commensalibacter communis]CAI3955282.1 Lipoprotein Med [Commensalibacter communis]
MGILKRRHFIGGIGSFFLPSYAQAETTPLSSISLLPQDGSIAFCYSGPKTDGGWGTLHERGRLEVSKYFPKLRITSIENVPYSIQATRLFRYLVAEGVQMIITNSNYDNFLHDVSNYAQNVSFTECNGHITTANLGWFYLDHWYAFYIFGYISALITKTNKLGFISSFPIPSVYSSVNAITLGARKINPLINVQVIHTGSWFNPKVTIQAANALCDQGCDILLSIMNDMSYLRVAEQRNIKAFLYNNVTPPIRSKAYINSILCDFSKVYIQQIQQRINGTWNSKPVLLKLGQDYNISRWGTSISNTIRYQATALYENILRGYNPFQGPIYNNKKQLKVTSNTTMQNIDLYQWNWAVEGVTGL